MQFTYYFKFGENQRWHFFASVKVTIYAMYERPHILFYWVVKTTYRMSYNFNLIFV